MDEAQAMFCKALFCNRGFGRHGGKFTSLLLRKWDWKATELAATFVIEDAGRNDFRLIGTLLCETDDCFLHVHLIGTNVHLPKSISKIQDHPTNLHLEIDPALHSAAVLHTRQYCL